jgi:hypothetical protein
MTIGQNVLTPGYNNQQAPHLLSFIVDRELDRGVNGRPFISRNSRENYIIHLEPGTESTVGVEPGDPLVSNVREKLFTLRLGQLSTRYASPCRAQEN